MRHIDQQYTRRPFYGSRRMAVYLNGVGYEVNRKRVQRLMRLLGLEGVAPGPHTSRPHPAHAIYATAKSPEAGREPTHALLRRQVQANRPRLKFMMCSGRIQP